jgi:hypothetical protein
MRLARYARKKYTRIKNEIKRTWPLEYTCWNNPLPMSKDDQKNTGKKQTYRMYRWLMRLIYHELDSRRLDGIHGRESKHQRICLSLDPRHPSAAKQHRTFDQQRRTWYWLSPITSIENNHFSKFSASRSVMPDTRSAKLGLLVRIITCIERTNGTSFRLYLLQLLLQPSRRYRRHICSNLAN